MLYLEKEVLLELGVLRDQDLHQRENFRHTQIRETQREREREREGGREREKVSVSFVPLQGCVLAASR